MKTLGIVILVFIAIPLTIGACSKETGVISQETEVLGKETEAETHFLKGVDYANKGMLDEAIVEYTKVIEINPRSAEAYYNRGLAYDNQGQHDKAISDYNKSIEINPLSAEAYNSRGVTYLMLKDEQKGCSDLKRACELGVCSDYEFAKSKGYCELGSLAISANWYPVQEDDEKTVYIERGRMKGQGDKISYWEYWAFKKPQEWEGKQYFSRMSYHTADCKERMTGATKVVVHDKEGNVVFSYNYPLDMKPVIPDTLGEILLDKACALKERVKQ